MTAVQVNIQQGTPEWHDLIRRTIGGSEVGILFGLGHITRDELIKQKATGIVPEPSEFQAALFAIGHEIEAKARAIIEDLTGDEFFPSVFVDENNKSRASLDGINLAGDVIIEIKTLNKKNKSYILEGEVDPINIHQVMYNMGMSGAERCLFIVSDGTPENTFYTYVHFDIEWMDNIQSAITQFWLDVDAYQPEQSKSEPVLMPIMQLPALSIRVDGQLAIESNLEAFGDKLTGFIAGINRDPQTDEDFGNIVNAVKFLKSAEEELDNGLNYALSRIECVDRLIKRVEYFKGFSSSTRIPISKLPETRRKEIRDNLIIAAKNEYAKYCAGLEKEIDPIKLMLVQPDFAQAIKGVKTMSSSRNNINTALAGAKSNARDIADELRECLDWYKENCLSFNYLFRDLQDIIYNNSDDFKLICESRIERHKQSEQEKATVLAEKMAEQEREKIRQEEEFKSREPMRIERELAEQERLKQQAIKDIISPAPAQLIEKQAEKAESDLFDEQKILAILQKIADKGEGNEVDRLLEAFCLGVQSVIHEI